jgi:hypothetical protein
LLRSLYQSLLDDATAEHVFATEFFGSSELAHGVFAGATRLLEAFMSDLLSRVNDPVCCALVLRVSSWQCSVLQGRGVTSLDAHFAWLKRVSGARLDAVINACQAACQAAPFSHLAVAGYHATGMTKRVSELLGSLIVLCSDDVSDVLVPQIHAVAACTIDLLDRIAKEFRDPVTSDVFLINNYNLIASALRAFARTNLSELFDQKLADATAHFIDLQLQQTFPKLAQIVRKAFVRIESRDPPLAIGATEGELKAIASEFKTTHEAAVRALRDGLFVQFGDFTNAREILRSIAKRLVLYWSKFELVARGVARGAPWLAVLISSQQLVANIRPLTELQI